MHYILDTGFFVVSREYYHAIFPTFWEFMDNAVKEGLISSVEEVKAELNRYGGEQKYLIEWLKQHKHIFTDPTEDEQDELKKIFAIKRFQLLVGLKKRLKGEAVADPFVIAKAMSVQGAVVTSEKPTKKDKTRKAQGPLKIPDVCKHFNIPCLSPREFMEEQKWKF